MAKSLCYASGVTRLNVVAAIGALTLIGSLAILLLAPAINSSQRPRQNYCANNLRNVGFAMLQFEQANKYFPGYANTVGSKVTSYVVPILPYLERQDVYRNWSDPQHTIETAAAPQMEDLQCPAVAFQTKPPWSSFIANGGRAESPPGSSLEEIKAGGLCFDLRASAQPKIKTDLDYVAKHDGTSTTLLMTENLQSGSWVVPNAKIARLWNTFLWFNDPPDTENKIINWDVGAPATARNFRHARPSSNHKGGVNVYFCDNHVQFISEEIDYVVYKQLMTPNGARAGDTDNRPLRNDAY